jgi:hypothetical protein
MFPIRTKNRKAISAVLTTIIILVASIVLGTGVVIFSTGLFQTGGQQQSVQIISLKGWVNVTANNPGYGWGAFAVKNTGDKLLSVNTITVRSATVPYANWYADTDPTRVTANFQAQLNITKEDNNGNPKGSLATGVITGPATGNIATQCSQTTNPAIPFTCAVIQGIPYTTTTPMFLQQQTGPITLSPGSGAMVYFKMPNGLFTQTDSGVTSTVSILAGTAPVSQTVRMGNP